VSQTTVQNDQARTVDRTFSPIATGLSALPCLAGCVSLVAHGLAHGLVVKNAGDPLVLGVLAGVGLCRGCLGQDGLTLLGFRVQTGLFLKPGLFACRLAGFPRFGDQDAFLLPGLALRRGFLCGTVGLKKGGFCFREPPRVYRRVRGSMIRLLFRQRSSLRRMPPLLRSA
jgi:hypothetical protein